MSFNAFFNFFRTAGPITTDGLLNITCIILSLIVTYLLATRQSRQQTKLTQSKLINDERPYFNIDNFGRTLTFSFYNKSSSIVNFLDVYVEVLPEIPNEYGEILPNENSDHVYRKYSLGHSQFNTPISQRLEGSPISCIIECTTLAGERIIFFYLHEQTSSVHVIKNKVRYSDESATHEFLSNNPRVIRDYIEFKSKFN